PPNVLAPVSVIALAPALNVALPLTVTLPACSSAPPEVTDRLPLTVVRLASVVAPELTSTAPPGVFRRTDPDSALPACDSRIAPLLACRAAAPPTVRAPTWEIEADE